MTVAARWSGMQWTLRVSGAICTGRSTCTDGEIVWCWRRDPGATSAVSPARQRGQERLLPGEITYKPSTHCAGKAGMSRLYLSKPCAFLLPMRTRCCGRSRRPAFPAPSVRERAQRIGTTRAKTSRGNENVCLPRRCERSEAIQLCRSEKESWIASSLRSSQ